MMPMRFPTLSFPSRSASFFQSSYPAWSSPSPWRAPQQNAQTPWSAWNNMNLWGQAPSWNSGYGHHASPHTRRYHQPVSPAPAPVSLNKAIGTADNDTIQQWHQGGKNKAYGGAGNDHITQHGDYNQNLVDAGEGDDVVGIYGHYNHSRVSLGEGDDVFTLEGNYNTGKVDGGAGDDLFYLSGAHNRMLVNGGSGTNQLVLDGERTAWFNINLWTGKTLLLNPTQNSLYAAQNIQAVHFQQELALDA